MHLGETRVQKLKIAILCTLSRASSLLSSRLRRRKRHLLSCKRAQGGNRSVQRGLAFPATLRKTHNRAARFQTHFPGTELPAWTLRRPRQKPSFKNKLLRDSQLREHPGSLFPPRESSWGQLLESKSFAGQQRQRAAPKHALGSGGGEILASFPLPPKKRVKTLTLYIRVKQIVGTPAR